MGHQIAHGDRLGIRGGNLEIQIVVDVAVEVDFALFDLLHYGGPGEELGNRSGTEQGLRRNRRPLLDIGKPISLFNQDLAILDDDDRGAGDVLPLQLHRDQAIEIRGQVIGSHRGRTRRRRHRRSHRL